MLAAALLACACGAPEEPHLDYRRGLNAIGDRRFDLARDYFALDLESRPEHVEGWRQAARAWSSGPLQSASRAIECWRQVLELDPGDPEAALGVARGLNVLGEWDEALELLEGAPPAEAATRLRAAILLRTDPEAALGLLEEALAEAGATSGLHGLAARACESLGDDDCTLGHAQAAILADPLDERSYYLLSRVWSRRGDAERSMEAQEIHRGLRAAAAGEGPSGPTPVERLRALRGIEPRIAVTAPAYRLHRLRLLAEAGFLDEAASELSLALADDLELDPFEAASLAERVGDRVLAVRLLEKIAFAGSPTEAREARYRLARIHRFSGQLEPAVTLLEEALADEPFEARTHCLLGDVRVAQGRPTEGAALLERSLELAPWRIDCRLALAEVLRLAGAGDELAALLAAAPEPAPALTEYARRHGLS